MPFASIRRRCDDCSTSPFFSGRTLSYLGGNVTAVAGNTGCVTTVCGANSPLSRIVNFVDPECFCPQDCTDINGNVIAPNFVDPKTDKAPWYDPLRPESARFLGAIITKVTGLDSTLARSTQSSMGYGQKGTIGTLQTKLREIGIEAIMFACDCAAMEYGMRWLVNYFNGPCQDGCGTCDMAVRLCCPEPGDDADATEWILQDAGITDGPHWADNPLKDAECLVRNVNWTMASPSPYLFKCPDVCMKDEPMYLSDYNGDNAPDRPCCPPTFNDWFSGCAIKCCSLNNKYTIGQTAGTISLTTGTRAANDVWITAQVDRFGLNCPPVLPTPGCNGPNCITGIENCLMFKITSIPAMSTFVWDSVRREVYLETNGGLTRTPAFNLITLPDGEPFTWLNTNCRNICLCVAVPRQCAIGYGACETPGDPYLSITVEFTHYEL